ncbi:hypothetical protein ACFO0N_02220 [Halobium salinum]|uniref:Uncharacterized protein n=1 Tax=Halobium salinum TaxID=1364940 RepID=A0ABD5P7Q8_9EURY|nr:hypothetical protein [Halobium salinum]
MYVAPPRDTRAIGESPGATDDTRLGECVLAALADAADAAPDRLTDESVVTAVETETVERVVDRRLTVSDTLHERELSREKVARLNVGRELMPFAAAERDRFIPEGYAGGFATFLRTDEVRLSTCGACHGRQVTTCPGCNGKRLTRGAVCSRCEGSGNRTCRTCGGDGESFTLGLVRRRFTGKTAQSLDSGGKPTRIFHGATGQRVEVVPREPADDELKRETERYAVPVTTVSYEYEGESYTVYEVDGRPTATTLPETTSSGGSRLARLLGRR